MTDWWISLGSAGQVFACIAIPATILLLMQTIMMLIGLGSGHSDGDAGHDAGHDFGHDTGHDFGHDFDAHDVGGHDFDVGHDVADVTDGAFDGDANGDGSVDAGSHDGHGVLDGGLRLFTLRGLIAFFSVMGWVGALCSSGGMNVGLSVLIAVASGLAAMLLVGLIMKWLFTLQSDGTENIHDALGVSGTVYLRVPANRAGRGKVNAIIRGKLSEKNAVTDEETDINYGEEVVVIGISGDDTLIVRRKNRI